MDYKTLYEELKEEIERRDQLEQDPTESEKQLLATQFNGFMGEMKELNKEIAELKAEIEELKPKSSAWDIAMRCDWGILCESWDRQQCLDFISCGVAEKDDFFIFDDFDEES